MNKNNVYFFQTNIMYGSTTYLPYSAGVIAAYSFADESVSAHYNMGGIFFKREPIDDILPLLDNPAVAAFSNYIWNSEYNRAAARKIKELFPKCVIVFGGHSVGKGSMDSFSFVDFFIRGYGERAFKSLLQALAGNGDFAEIKSISYFDSHGALVHNGDDTRADVEYISPYLSGLFSKIIEDNPDIRFSAILETNRGCPYSCTYCDWCSLKSRIIEIPFDSVIQDIEWMAKNKIEFCYCADANFGILKRDEKIVKRLVEIHRGFGYPKKFRANYAKHNNDTVLQINRELNKYGLSRGVTLSFQSMSDNVLANIGRENMEISRFKELMKLYYDEGIPTYSELILGLPGETYDSFCQGIGELLNAGQHSSIMVYNCELLENSEMETDEYMERFKIRAAVTPVYLRHDAPSGKAQPEYSRSVVSTYSMPTDDWVRANMFAVLVQSCHSMGLLRCFAVYLRCEKGLEYADFYKGLQTFCEESAFSVPGEIYAVIKRHFEDITEGKGRWSYLNPVFGNVSWPYEEAFFLEALLCLDDFYSGVAPYLDKAFAGDKKLEELKRYQSFTVKRPGVRHVTASFTHDFQSYFNEVYKGGYVKLPEKHTAYIARDNLSPLDFAEFAAENVWFGRNEQKMLFTDIDEVSRGGSESGEIHE